MSNMETRRQGSNLFPQVPDRKAALKCSLPSVSSVPLPALVEPSVTPLRTCAVAVDGLQVREVLDVRRRAGHRQQSREVGVRCVERKC